MKYNIYSFITSLIIYDYASRSTRLCILKSSPDSQAAMQNRHQSP